MTKVDASVFAAGLVGWPGRYMIRTPAPRVELLGWLEAAVRPDCDR